MPGKRRKLPQEYVQECFVDDDGVRPVRPAKPHSADKLAILASYLPAFTQASKSAPHRYFVDALSGPGMYQFTDDDRARNTLVAGRFAKGSTLIARDAAPPFDKILAMDRNGRFVKALQARTGRDGRVVVRQGDCNRDLIPFMEQELPDRRAPVLVFLDPEGFEVEWKTLRALSGFRQGPKKTELLFYFAAPSLLRFDEERLKGFTMNVDRAMPQGREWRKQLLEARERGDEGREIVQDMVDYMKEALERDLGYGSVFARPIGPKGPEDRGGRVFYYLVYATDFVPSSNEGPMDWIFANLWGSSSAQGRLL